MACPLQILSDNGREFECNLMHELCRCLDVQKIRSTIFKPSTSGGVERFHLTMNKRLGKVVDIHQRDWDERLPSVLAAYRASKHESTGSTTYGQKTKGQKTKGQKNKAKRQKAKKNKRPKKEKRTKGQKSKRPKDKRPKKPKSQKT